MGEAKIYGYEPGAHNSDLGLSLKRLTREGVYKDLSTVIIIPALNTVATKAASSWWNMMMPPNHKVVKLFTQNMEVGEAYSQTIEQVLAHPELSKYKYILTIEADNVVPPDGMVKLLEKMEAHMEYSCISGLYWTKGAAPNQDGIGGVPQIWGDCLDPVLNFRPQPPRLDGGLQECCGLGQGFCLFRTSVFKDERLRRPWFKTTASVSEGCYSQDLFFWSDARKHGHRCAVACDILVGHVDMSTGLCILRKDMGSMNKTTERGFYGKG